MGRYVINQKFMAVTTGKSDGEGRMADGGSNDSGHAPRQGAREPGAPDPPSAVRHPPSSVRVAEMFGIGLDETYEVTLYDHLVLDVRAGDVVFVTGPSGSGKSVLLRRLVEALRSGERASGPDEARPAVPSPPVLVDLARIELPAERSVIDGLPCPFERGLELLSSAGLADAFLCLRRPGELSDGQRWRLCLAHALCECEVRNAECGVRVQGKGFAASTSTPHSELRTPSFVVLVADEFCSTLDRLSARAIAYRVRRVASRYGLTVLAASAHDDILEDLAPDVLVVKHEGDQVEVQYRDAERRP